MKWIYEEFSIQYFYRSKGRNIGEKSVGLLFLCQLFLKAVRNGKMRGGMFDSYRITIFTGFHALHFSLKFFS